MIGLVNSLKKPVIGTSLSQRTGSIHLHPKGMSPALRMGYATWMNAFGAKGHFPYSFLFLLYVLQYQQLY